MDRHILFTLLYYNFFRITCWGFITPINSNFCRAGSCFRFLLFVLYLVEMLHTNRQKYTMGSKKRIFYAAPQKKIKQKRKNKFEDVKKLPKVKRYRRSLEYKQRLFINKKFRKHKYHPLKTLYSFYNKVVKPFKVLCEYKSESIWFFDNLLSTINPERMGVIYKLSKKGDIRLYLEERVVNLLSFCFYKINSLYILDLEVQTLFQLGNSNQQYYLNTLGVNYPYFQTTSSGKCLRLNFGDDVSKSLKKSPKLNKALVDYYFYAATFDFVLVRYTHTLIKPFNKKALILFHQIQTNSAYYPTIIGFRKYYKINYKTSRRIKKKIKKKILSENLRYRPYKDAM